MKIKLAPHGAPYIDITEMIEYNGVSWELKPSVVPGSGENLAGETMRKVRRWKDCISIKCVPLTLVQKSILTDILKRSTVDLKIAADDNADNISRVCIVTDISSANLRKDGLWVGIKFTLEMK